MTCLCEPVRALVDALRELGENCHTNTCFLRYPRGPVSVSYGFGMVEPTLNEYDAQTAARAQLSERTADVARGLVGMLTASNSNCGWCTDIECHLIEALDDYDHLTGTNS